MIPFKQAVQKVKESTEFQQWKNRRKNTFLCFGMIIPEKEDYWSIGFYDPEKDEITNFIAGKTVIKEKPDKVFKTKSMQVLPIQLDELKIKSTDALEKARSIEKEKYSSETPIETILIIQNLKPFGLIWNITIVTMSLTSINIKINATTGELLQEKKISLFSFKK
ncbi:hypothetical protein DRJ16_06645 [Candidatus Woesearchaeota archaeon]|nr:MAG: hypothetical protein DRJ16_06645 [Candidatus Woesearchaeota archaeon]